MTWCRHCWTDHMAHEPCRPGLFAGQKEKGDALRKYMAAAELPNPEGWNEPGMQPITWAEERPSAMDYTRTEARILAHMILDGSYTGIHDNEAEDRRVNLWLASADEITDRHFELAYQAWLHERTRPETRWEFCDRMLAEDMA